MYSILNKLNVQGVYKKIIFFFVICIVFFADTAFAGFGITPPYVRNSTLTRGSEFTQQIILVRGNPIEDLKAEITMFLPGISEWVTIDKGFEFIMPAGEKQVKMNVTVLVPGDAKYGTYTGNIRVRTSSPNGPESGTVSIALGAQIDVDLRVVDEIFDFEVKRVELTELEEGYTKWWLDYPGKISLGIYIFNTGNVEASPSKVRLDIYDRKGETLLETIESDNKIPTVDPFETKKVTAELKTKLSAGSYLVKYQIYKETEITKAGELTLTILPIGTVPGYVPYGIAGISLQGANIITPMLMVFDGLSFGDSMSLVIPVILFIILIIWTVLYFKNSFKEVKLVKQPAHVPNVAMRRTAPAVGSVRRNPVRAHGGIIDLSKK